MIPRIRVNGKRRRTEMRRKFCIFERSVSYGLFSSFDNFISFFKLFICFIKDLLSAKNFITFPLFSNKILPEPHKVWRMCGF